MARPRRPRRLRRHWRRCGRGRGDRAPADLARRGPSGLTRGGPAARPVPPRPREDVVTRYDLDGQTLDERPDTVLASILSASGPRADHTRVPRRRTGSAPGAGGRARPVRRTARRGPGRHGPPRRQRPLHRRMAGRPPAPQPAGARPAPRRPRRRPGPRARVRAHARGGRPRPPAGPRRLRRTSWRRGPPNATAWRPSSLQPLGPEEPAPPLEALPEAAADHGRRRPVGDRAHGHGGGRRDPPPAPGCWRWHRGLPGRARVASTPEAALDTMEPGDVLVVRFTTPAYNTVLSLAGGIVTADGGPLSHAAVMAHELGIPPPSSGPAVPSRPSPTAPNWSSTPRPARCTSSADDALGSSARCGHRPTRGIQLVVILVDAANVVGSRPTGWWRDRAGAAAALVERLGAASADGRLDGAVVVVLRARPTRRPRKRPRPRHRGRPRAPARATTPWWSWRRGPPNRATTCCSCRPIAGCGRGSRR